MFTLQLEDSIIVSRPVEEVFAYIDDINLEHEWQPYLKKWEQTPDPGQNGLGSLRRYENQYMGRRFTNIYKVTVYEPNRRVMCESTPEAAIQATGGTLWEPADGGTKVTFIFNPQLGDFWGYIPKPTVRRIYNRTLKQNMVRLKRVLENAE